MSPRVIQAKRVGRRWKYIGGTLGEVVQVIEAGGLVVYPTETVYGLGADPFNAAAVGALYRAKARPPDQPVSVMVANREEAHRLARFNPAAEYLWDHFMPGPLTILLEVREEAPGPPVTAGGLLGLRMADHPVALALVRAYGPLTATSANRHGDPSPRRAGEAMDQLGEAVGLCIDAGPCTLGVESTVVDASSGKAIVKREGVLARERLESHGGG